MNIHRLGIHYTPRLHRAAHTHSKLDRFAHTFFFGRHTILEKGILHVTLNQHIHKGGVKNLLNFDSLSPLKHTYFTWSPFFLFF